MQHLHSVPRCVSDIRSRAFLRLLTFVGAALMFMLLGCGLGEPPGPSKMVIIDGLPSALLAGVGQDFTVTVAEPGKGQTLAQHKVTLWESVFRSPTQTQTERRVLSSMNTDSQGKVTFHYRMPEQLQPDDIVRLQVEAETPDASDGQSIHTADYMLNLLPNVSFWPLNQNNALPRDVSAPLVVQAYDNRHQRPLTNQIVHWSFDPVYTQDGEQGTTDANGLIQIPIVSQMKKAPSELNLFLTTKSQQDDVAQNLLFSVYEAPPDVLVSTDKPVYQPGQTIHIRALAIQQTARKAAQDVALHLQVRDPRGNIISERQLMTSHFGVASTDFALDSQAATGDYTIQTSADSGVQISRVVEVKPYTLPRFAIKFTSAQPYYSPDATATGMITATYFFGKPVTNGVVQIQGFAADAPDGTERIPLFTVTGQTDAQGRYRYSFKLPENFVNQLDNHSSTLDLAIKVTDTADHAEQAEETLTVAAQPLLLEAVAESGRLRADLENLIYLQTSYPDGRAAQATLTVTVGNTTTVLTTDAFGLTTLKVTPQASDSLKLKITARAAEGSAATPTTFAISVPIASSKDNLLLRPAKAEMMSGEALPVDIWVSHANPNPALPSTVLMQVLKGGAIFNTQILTFTGSHTQTKLVFDPALVGTVEIFAHLVGNGANLRADGPALLADDQRLLLINPGAAQVDAHLDAATYRPGATATLDIQAKYQGKPMQAALGVSIVDESVFTLGAQDPAFARTYFLLAKELTASRYQLTGFAAFGEESSPYQFNDHYQNPAVLDNMRQAHMQAKQTALFGALAQELLLTQTAQAATNLTTSSGVKAVTPGPIDGLWLVTLLGAAVYTGRRNRRQTVFILVVVAISLLLWTACAPAASAPAPGGQAAAPAAPQAEIADQTTATRSPSALTAGKPHLRQFFPETLLWLPAVETDAAGYAHIPVPIADSLTTWRVSIIASDQQGNLGSAEIPLRVFQDFFVEPDLPNQLSQGDLIDVPVSVFNYLAQPQVIRLNVTKADWFELRKQTEFTVTVGANEVTVITIPLRVTGVGQGEFKLTATGNQLSDAVVRSVTVVYNAEPVSYSHSGRLSQDLTYEVPSVANALPGSAHVTVRLYPGLVSQVVQGLASMLREPTGCFEQTSSTTYPNVMILSYLQATKQIDPQLQASASRLIEMGYQRLLGFEVDNDPGGFSLFGEPPAQTMLTAYGLMEFSAMSKVSYVDPALLQRTAQFLLQQQQADGSWNSQGATIESGLENIGAQKLATTAYLTWALADAGFAQTPEITRAVAYIQSQFQPKNDAYVVALVANALVAVNAQDDQAHKLFDDLIQRSQVNQLDQLVLTSHQSTYMGGDDTAATLDSTAMLAIALMRANYRLDAAQQALNYLLAQRSAGGGFSTTQSTVLVLKALILAEQLASANGSATITVSLNHGASQHVTIDGSQNDPQVLTFAGLTPDANTLNFSVTGERLVPYQVVTEYAQPWTVAAKTAASHQALNVAVHYASNIVQVNATVSVTAEVTLLNPHLQGTIMAVLGVPPGFTPVQADLEALLEKENGDMMKQQKVDYYELHEDKIVLYLSELKAGQPYIFHYQLLARIPGVVQTPASLTYAYYTPSAQAVVAPQQITVSKAQVSVGEQVLVKSSGK